MVYINFPSFFYSFKWAKASLDGPEMSRIGCADMDYVHVVYMHSSLYSATWPFTDC